MSKSNLSIEIATRDELLTVFSKQDFHDQVNLDQSAIKKTWSELRGSEDINQILMDYKISRQQAYRTIGNEYAMQIEKDAIYDVLKGVAEFQISIMMTVGNKAVVQSSQTLIHQVNTIGDWISIFDGETTMHLQEAFIKTAWIVKKPSISGMAISVELFDSAGRVVAIFSGSEEAGNGYCKWRKLLEQVSLQSGVEGL